MELLQLIIQGGAVGIAVLLILYMYKKDKMFNKSLNNHLRHSYETNKKLVNAINSFTKAISGLKGVIRGCPNNKLNK